MIEVRAGIAMRGSGRRVPMHPELARALSTLRAQLPMLPCDIENAARASTVIAFSP